jgi:hypothetical protein
MLHSICRLQGRVESEGGRSSQSCRPELIKEGLTPPAGLCRAMDMVNPRFDNNGVRK